jgi:hypothetical protein
MSKTTLSRFLPPFLCPTNTQQTTNTHGRATKTPPSEDSTNEIHLEILSDTDASVDPTSATTSSGIVNNRGSLDVREQAYHARSLTRGHGISQRITSFGGRGGSHRQIRAAAAIHRFISRNPSFQVLGVFETYLRVSG